MGEIALNLSGCCYLETHLWRSIIFSLSQFLRNKKKSKRNEILKHLWISFQVSITALDTFIMSWKHSRGRRIELWPERRTVQLAVPMQSEEEESLHLCLSANSSMLVHLMPQKKKKKKKRELVKPFWILVAV